MTAYTAVFEDNASLKGIGAGNFATASASTEEANLTTGDTFAFSFPLIPGMKLVGVQPVVNGKNGVVTAPVAAVITTTAYGYTVLLTTGTVVGTAKANVLAIAIYA